MLDPNKLYEECPKCQGYCSASYFDTENDEAWRIIECDECHYEWYEVFKFSHNEEVPYD